MAATQNGTSGAALAARSRPAAKSPRRCISTDRTPSISPGRVDRDQGVRSGDQRRRASTNGVVQGARRPPGGRGPGRRRHSDARGQTIGCRSHPYARMGPTWPPSAHTRPETVATRPPCRRQCGRAMLPGVPATAGCLRPRPWPRRDFCHTPTLSVGQPSLVEWGVSEMGATKWELQSAE